MRSAAFILTFGFIAAILVSGCDSVDVAGSGRFVRPTVSVYFVNGTEAGFGKSQASFDVILNVVTISGQDYSPDSVRVDDAVETEVTFDLVLPPDSVYGFRVVFRQDGRLAGEGGVLQLVTEETSQINIPVVSAGDEPWFAILPSMVDMRTASASDSVSLQMRYYGDARNVAGLAARFDVNGPHPVSMNFQGVVFDTLSSSQVSLAWQFDEPVSGVTDVGIIRVPLSQIAEFCLGTPSDTQALPSVETRIVNQEGEITIIGGSGACIDVKE